MLLRGVVGALLGVSMALPAVAGSMSAEEARRYVAGKMFSFSCFDGTRGAGRIFDDGGAAGAVQMSGSGPTRHLRLPVNTLQVRGQAICASLKGMPFEPCFNLDKNDKGFRGSVSGMGFAYCDFKQQGAAQMLMARARTRGPRSLTAPGQREAQASRTDVTQRVETPRVESTKIEPVKAQPAPVEAVPELRKSTD